MRNSSSLEVVIPCQRSHLTLLAQHTVPGLERHIGAKAIYVIVLPRDLKKFRETLGSRIALLDADTLIPDMTLSALKQYPLAWFPVRAGWYYQQLCKFAFALRPSTERHYLIWDADTIPLRPMTFFDAEGRMLFNKADEYHLPYFENYARLLGHEAQREFSFIAEHMAIDKAILRDMLGTIERRFPGDESWAWKIIKNLRGDHVSLFSEYETYGHYVKHMYPEKAAYRSLPWSRHWNPDRTFTPSPKLLARLAERYFYSTFELYKIDDTPAPLPETIPPTPATDHADVRPVAVRLCLAGGQQFSLTLPSDSPLLRRLFTALASHAQIPPASPATFFQIPLEDGRVACSFFSTQLVSLVTEPPVLLEPDDSTEDHGYGLDKEFQAQHVSSFTDTSRASKESVWSMAKPRCLLVGLDGFDFEILVNLVAFYTGCGFDVRVGRTVGPADLLVIQRGRCEPAAVFPHAYRECHIYDYVFDGTADARACFPNAKAAVVISPTGEMSGSMTSPGPVITAMPPVVTHLWRCDEPDGQRPTRLVHIGHRKPTGSHDPWQVELEAIARAGGGEFFGSGWLDLADAPPSENLHGPIPLHDVGPIYRQSQRALGIMYPYQRGKTISSRMWQAPLAGCLLLSEAAVAGCPLPGVELVSSYWSAIDHEPAAILPHAIVRAATEFWDQQTKDLAATLGYRYRADLALAAGRQFLHSGQELPLEPDDSTKKTRS